MLDDTLLLARICALRPWWWWMFPWAYTFVLEDSLGDVIGQLEDERQTVTKVAYQCPHCPHCMDAA